MFNSYEHLKEQIYAFGLTEYEASIIRSAKPAIKINRERANEDDILIGASKLGGNPDLPPDFIWPYWGDKPLTFIGQFNLSEVANAPIYNEVVQQKTLFALDTLSFNRPIDLYDFPDEGRLYFFYDADVQPWYDRKDSYLVHYIPDELVKLERRSHPIQQGVYSLIKALHPHRISFDVRPSLSFDCYLDEMRISIPDYPTRFNKNQKDNWDSLFDLWFAGWVSEFKPYHYFLGHAIPIQGSVERHAVIDTKNLTATPRNPWRDADGNLVDVHEEATQWQFLFQIDTDAR